MLKIIADDAIPYLRGCLEQAAEMHYIPGAEISATDCVDAHALITRTRTKSGETLLSGSSVDFVVSATIGTDHMQLDWLEQKGITWRNCPGCNSGSVNQYVLALVAHLQQAGRLNFEGTRAGVVGYGNVGSKVARSLSLLGFEVQVCDPLKNQDEVPFPLVDLTEIFKFGGVISLHVPLEREGEFSTLAFVNEERLSDAPTGTVLINSSRGEIIDEAALKNRIGQGGFDAVIDVWENEPAIDLELLNQCIIATPHIAGYSADGKYQGTRMSVKALAKHFDIEAKIPDFESTPQRWNDVQIPEQNLDRESTVSQIILQTYPINEDDALLRIDPSQFESLRKNYRIRREFPCWKVNKSIGEISNLLKDLGFIICN